MTVFEDMEKKMSKNVDDFWQDHSLKFLEMAFRTDRRETLSNPDGYGKKTGDCGDTVEFFLIIKNDRIETISYNVNGCMNTNACANAIVSLVEGKSLDEAWAVTPEAVSNYLESLPEDHFHCAELSVGALYLSLANAMELSRSPWKKLY